MSKQKSKKEERNKKSTLEYFEHLYQRTGVKFEGDLRNEEDVEEYIARAKCIMTDRWMAGQKKKKSFEHKNFTKPNVQTNNGEIKNEQ